MTTILTEPETADSPLTDDKCPTCGGARMPEQGGKMICVNCG